MGRLLWILAAAFLAGLGVVIGNRMSSDAIGVVVGVALGAAILSIVIACIGIGISEYLRHQEAMEVERTKQMTIALEAARFAALSHAMPQNPTPTFYAGGRYRQIPPPREVN